MDLSFTLLPPSLSVRSYLTHLKMKGSPRQPVLFMTTPRRPAAALSWTMPAMTLFNTETSYTRVPYIPYEPRTAVLPGERLLPLNLGGS
jgi:hypothetical protein